MTLRPLSPPLGFPGIGFICAGLLEPDLYGIWLALPLSDEEDEPDGRWYGNWLAWPLPAVGFTGFGFGFTGVDPPSFGETFVGIFSLLSWNYSSIGWVLTCCESVAEEWVE
jgi:hypothetical protein